MSTTRSVQRTVLLFEGRSDSLAFRALARRHGHDIDRFDLVDLDGITNLRSRVQSLRSDARVGRILGLYDAAEGRYVMQVLTDVGLLAAGADPGDIGFFGCERDLEDEVIAAAGPDLVQETLLRRGELGRFQVFQGQPAQRERSIREQLHRFAGTAAGRKARFSADIVDVLPFERMPPALSALLDEALRSS